MTAIGLRRSVGAGIDPGLSANPIARLERSPRGGYRLLLDGGHDELRISLPTGEEIAVLERLRLDLASMEIDQ